MIVEFNGSEYKFSRSGRMLDILYTHELLSVLRNPEYFQVKLRGMNICIPEHLAACSLMDVYRVAHGEVKTVIAEIIFKEQQNQINDLFNRLTKLERRNRRI